MKLSITDPKCSARELTESPGESGTNTTAATTVACSGQCKTHERTEGQTSCGDAATGLTIPGVTETAELLTTTGCEESTTVPAAQVKRATVARVRRRTQSRTSLDDDSSSEARVTPGRTETIILATRTRVMQRPDGEDSGKDRLHAARGQTAGLRRRPSTPSGQTDPRKSAGSTQSVLSLGAGRCAALWSRRDSSQQDRLEQADRREAQSERTSKLERSHREAAQLQELRDTLSDGTPEQQALSHRDAEHEPHPGSKSRTSRPDTW